MFFFVRWMMARMLAAVISPLQVSKIRGGLQRMDCVFSVSGTGQVQPSWSLPPGELHLLLPAQDAPLLRQTRPQGKAQVRHPLLQIHWHWWLCSGCPDNRCARWWHTRGKRGFWHGLPGVGGRDRWFWWKLNKDLEISLWNLAKVGLSLEDLPSWGMWICWLEDLLSAGVLICVYRNETLITKACLVLQSCHCLWRLWPCFRVWWKPQVSAGGRDIAREREREDHSMWLRSGSGALLLF